MLCVAVHLSRGVYYNAGLMAMLGLKSEDLGSLRWLSFNLADHNDIWGRIQSMWLLNTQETNVG